MSMKLSPIYEYVRSKITLDLTQFLRGFDLRGDSSMPWNDNYANDEKNSKRSSLKQTAQRLKKKQ